MAMTESAIVLLAHAGWGPGGWWWGPFIPLLWVAFIATAAWFVIRVAGPHRRRAVDRGREVLAERFARGELDADEYRERLSQLR
jgi:putative membrane protein